MEDAQIAIIVMLSVLIIVLIIVTIILCVYRDNQQYKDGDKIYIPGFQQPIYIQQVPSELSITINDDDATGSITIYEQLTKVNGIPYSIYQKAKSKNFILPCYIKTQDDIKEYIAIFYDAGNNNHYIRISGQTLSAIFCKNLNSYSVKSITEKPKSETKTRETAEQPKLEITEKTVKLTYNAAKQNFTITSGVEGENMSLEDMFEEYGHAMFFENTFYYWNTDKKSFTGALFPVFKKGAETCGFAGLYHIEVPDENDKETKKDKIVILRDTKSQVENLLPNDNPENKTAKSVSIYGKTYWYVE